MEVLLVQRLVYSIASFYPDLGSTTPAPAEPDARQAKHFKGLGAPHEIVRWRREKDVLSPLSGGS